ncbi:hypothetical protein D623_10010775 [Myotis brandtii]|uniref:Uncharacterized protein n=1 Tax=Myotis brandtii TaxID=109478 RepID=S7N8X7_MYOBR|nr:hypothetical protein D623_10010775 [Myotis brandtii]
MAVGLSRGGGGHSAGTEKQTIPRAESEECVSNARPVPLGRDVGRPMLRKRRQYVDVITGQRRPGITVQRFGLWPGTDMAGHACAEHCV